MSLCVKARETPFLTRIHDIMIRGRHGERGNQFDAYSVDGGSLLKATTKAGISSDFGGMC
jgi:hypothetical protein